MRRKQRDFPHSQRLPSHRLHQCLLQGIHPSPPSPQLLLACASCAQLFTSTPHAHQPSQKGTLPQARQSFCARALWPHLSGEGKWALTGMKLALM